MMMLAHGLASSGIFRAANIMYERSHSRRVALNKGALADAPRFTLFWFLLIAANLGGPFTLNLFREILIIRRI